MRSRAAAVALAASLLASAGWLLPAPATAAEACVGVIVDARLAGGRLSTGCTTGDPDSGLEALTEAGFSYAFAPRYPGLVCSIDDTPDCAEMSTTDHWSYWYREPGSRAWVYSSVGAGSRDPEPGSTEAWVWQDGGRQQPPDVAFDALCPVEASPSPSPARTKKPSRTTTPDAQVTTGPPASDRTADAESRDRDEEPSSDASSPSEAGTSPTQTTGSTQPSGSPVPDASLSAEPAAALRDGDGGGSPGTLIAGGALVLLLAGAAVWRGRARRP